MKKLLSLALLFVATISFAQEEEPSIIYVLGIDGLNIVDGSAPTGGHCEFDIHFGAKVTGLGAASGHFLPLEIGLNGEVFKAIGFYKFGVEFGWMFKVKIGNNERIRLVPSMETAFLRRAGNVEPFFKINHDYIIQSADLSIRYKLVGGLYAGLKGGLTFRGDLKDAGYKDFMVFNGTVIVVYCIEL